jgi:hypothetical protein
MSVTLFGIGLAAVLACASFVAYWYGWRFAKMLFYSATVNALGATIVYTIGLPKMVSTIITAVSCSVFFFQFMHADPNAMSPSHKRKLRKLESARFAFVREDEVEETTRRYAEALAERENKASDTGDKWERELGDALRR